MNEANKRPSEVLKNEEPVNIGFNVNFTVLCVDMLCYIRDWWIRMSHNIVVNVITSIVSPTLSKYLG